MFDNVTTIVEKLKACAPDIVFNLTESFHHDRSHEPNIPALLELMKVRYTGAGPEGLLLCKDKALAKTTQRVELEMSADLATMKRVVIVEKGNDRSDVTFGALVRNAKIDPKLVAGP